MGRGQPGSVSKFPPLLWVKLWVRWVGRGYTEISRYFPASWINWVTLVTKTKLLYLLRFWITFESPIMPLWCAFFASQRLILCAVYHSSPSSHVRSSLIGSWGKQTATQSQPGGCRTIRVRKYLLTRAPCDTE